MLKKFSLVDYIIIILVICAVIFAFIHITSDDSSDIQKTAFDTSTVNKIPDTYFSNYLEGNIIKANVVGFNSTNGEEISINGTVKWISDDSGSDVKLLVENENGTYLIGLYKNVPEADIYLNTISLETDGSKYENLVELTLKPEKITSLNDLVDKIANDTDYEISTEISIDSIDTKKMQEVTNLLKSHGKRFAIKSANTGLENQIILVRANGDNINDGDSVLGNVNGVTGDITIRIYNCTDSQLDAIKNGYDVTNIRNF